MSLTSPYQHPSNVLVRLCATMFSMEADPARDRLFGQWCDVVCPEVANAELGEPWGLAQADLWRTKALAWIEGRPLRPPASVAEFWKLAEAVSILDHWHMPLTRLGSQGSRLRESHRIAQERFVLFGRFDEGLPEGRLIPARALAETNFGHHADRALLDPFLKLEPLDDTGGIRERVPLLASLLRHTAFLPARLRRMDVDATGKPTEKKIRLCYRRSRAAVATAGLLAADSVRVMVAPMAESREDAAPCLTADLDWYGITPAYPKQRIGEVLAAAVNQEAHLLCLPELTLDESDLPAFVEELHQRRLAFLDERGRLPPLSYLFLGISRPAPGPGRRGRNYLLLLDAEGNVLLRQSKLYRWNLDGDAQERFDFAPQFPGAANPILEDTKSGAMIALVDLEDIGRVATLICADMSANMPGDWLLGHAGLDWLHAPIMDQSTCWERDGRGPLGNWIVRRAMRAALVSEARVIVTNSMSLTHRVNDSNARRGLAGRYEPFEKCGIALLIDASQEEPAYDQMLVPLHATGPIVESRDWNQDWRDLRTLLTPASPADGL